MARTFTNDGVVIAKAVRDHLNTWDKLPVQVMLEDLGKDVPSMMLKQLSAAEKKKTYINGSYIGVWNFAVYIRVKGSDTASRLDAVACLNELSDWLTELDGENRFAHLPTLDKNKQPTSIQVTSTPSCVMRYDDGIEDYQVILSLEYKVRRKV